MRSWEWGLLLFGLTLFVLQAALASPHKSAAFDEEYHIAAGYAYLKTGDFRMSTSHPPLVNLLSAIPLLWQDTLNLPTDHPSWAASDYFVFSDVFLWQVNDSPQQILVWGRWPIIALGAVLTFVLFMWARQMAGALAGWVALALAVFDPNLLANSRLITTDLGVTCFLLLTMWRLWCWLERPSLRNLIFTGLLAGLTMSSKFTGLMVWPMIAGVLLLAGTAAHRRWRSLMAFGLLAYLALWAVFRFDVGPIPGFRWHIPIPAPFYPYSVWDTFMVIEQQPKAAFLLGQVSQRGWWYYFPVALLLKTPLPLLLLTAVGLFQALPRGRWRETAVLWLPPLLFMLLAMSGQITIGYRHILPVVPFLIMLAAYGVGRLETESWRLERKRSPFLASGLVLCLLLIWHAFATLRLYPHQEAFFNELAGGPARGSRLLVDANIDWGQDLLFLRDLLAQRGIDDVYLSYFGTALPEKYGIHYQPLPGFMRFTAGPEIDAYNPYTPLPGWYAISETSRRLGLMLQNTDMFAYFQDQEPVACAGYSICLYYVSYPADTPVKRVVVVGRSVSDIPAAELSVQPGEQVIAKWVQTPDVTITSAADTREFPHNFQQETAVFTNAFTLLGYALPSTTIQPGGAAQLTLYWQVGAGHVETPFPSQAAPLAAFVHISGTDPAQIVAQYDGWSTALSGLEPGDMITQPVTINVPADTPAGNYFVRLGLYSPQSGLRLPVTVDGEVQDSVLITAVTVSN